MTTITVPSGPPPLLPDIIGNAEELPPPPSTTEDSPPKTDKAKASASASAKANADTKPAGRSSGKSGPVDESKAEKLSRLLKLGNKRMSFLLFSSRIPSSLIYNHIVSFVFVFVSLLLFS